MPDAKPTPVEYLAAFVEMNFTLTQTMRELQQAQGGFVFGDLADALVAKYEIPLDQAREMVWEFVTNMNALIEYDGTVYHLVEPKPPSIEETITNFAVMAATYRPRKPRQVNLPIPRKQPVQTREFEQFRPRRSIGRLLRGAPESVIACYDNGGGKQIDRYTILFGGILWNPALAQKNWEAGLNPRVTKCLSMSYFPNMAGGVSAWGQCLAGSHLGKKVAWLDLPEHIREHVIAALA